MCNLEDVFPGDKLVCWEGPWFCCHVLACGRTQSFYELDAAKETLDSHYNTVRFVD